MLIPLPESSNHKHLSLINSILNAFYKAEVVTVIPYLFPVINEVGDVAKAYVTGYQMDPTFKIKTNILSDIGQRQMQNLENLVGFCKGLKNREEEVEGGSNFYNFINESTVKNFFGKNYQLPSIHRNLEKIFSIDSCFKVEHWILTSCKAQKIGNRERVTDFEENFFFSFEQLFELDADMKNDCNEKEKSVEENIDLMKFDRDVESEDELSYLEEKKIGHELEGVFESFHSAENFEDNLSTSSPTTPTLNSFYLKNRVKSENEITEELMNKNAELIVESEKLLTKVCKEEKEGLQDELELMFESEEEVMKKESEKEVMRKENEEINLIKSAEVENSNEKSGKSVDYFDELSSRFKNL
ncbi:hypothetical protein HK099_008019 [Clydaea vesicula]|uniref:Uncharacterized protein n=1 Tax=Clydaea vesicula TaxID=447962 RepID=A0AAD5XXW3_9FUNG|nr:hypothetical protein HK099_008019 [Clydaea vesicula]